MAGTFHQIYLKYVFAVKGRENLLLKPWREEVFKYMSGIITNKGQKSIIVNGVSDHVHVFVGLKPAQSPSDLIRDVKTILRILSMIKGLSKESFHGKMVSGSFPIHTHKLKMFINTF